MIEQSFQKICVVGGEKTFCDHSIPCFDNRKHRSTGSTAKRLFSQCFHLSTQKHCWINSKQLRYLWHLYLQFGYEFERTLLKKILYLFSLLLISKELFRKLTLKTSQFFPYSREDTLVTRVMKVFLRSEVFHIIIHSFCYLHSITIIPSTIEFTTLSSEFN